jgi:hypothetical protein
MHYRDPTAARVVVISAVRDLLRVDFEKRHYLSECRSKRQPYERSSKARARCERVSDTEGRPARVPPWEPNCGRCLRRPNRVMGAMVQARA